MSDTCLILLQVLGNGDDATQTMVVGAFSAVCIENGAACLFLLQVLGDGNDDTDTSGCRCSGAHGAVVSTGQLQREKEGGGRREVKELMLSKGLRGGDLVQTCRRPGALGAILSRGRHSREKEESGSRGVKEVQEPRSLRGADLVHFVDAPVIWRFSKVDMKGRRGGVVQTVLEAL